MKKYLYTFALTALMFVANINAQSVISASAPAVRQFEHHNVLPKVPAYKGAIPQAVDAYKYFDETLPTSEIIAGGNYGGSLLILAAGQRTTLPSPSGFVDSVTLVFKQTFNDSLLVLILKDTLYETQPGTFFHLIDIFPQPLAYHSVYIQGSSVSPGVPVTIALPHVQVPKDFFVAVQPLIIGGQFLNAGHLQTDMKPQRAASTDVSRSAFVALNLSNGQRITSLMEGLFIPEGSTEPLFGDFYITSYAEADFSSVSNGNSESSLAIHPNPASKTVTLTIPENSRNASFQIINSLGQVVRQFSAQGDAEMSIDVAELTAGTYRLVVTSGNAVTSSTLSIVR